VSTASLGEPDLLRTLHDQHAAAVWSYVCSLTHDGARAHDVVQETLLRAWRNPQVLDQSARSARAWLFTVARHLVIDEQRTRRARSEVVTDVLPERGTADPAEAAVDRQVVLAALRRLTPEHRDVLVECYFRGSTIAEAAASLGVPAGTVKSRTHYALRALRLALDELGAPR
jgi:RNA polymerase sigma-70 factor (ECF subfamily)